MIHELKTWPEYFHAVRTGEKTFEVRKDDRGFQVGDVLHLFEWDPTEKDYTGYELKRTVTYRLAGPGFGIEPEYVVLGLANDKPSRQPGVET